MNFPNMNPDFLDNNGYITAQPGTSSEDNGILFTAYFIYLSQAKEKQVSVTNLLQVIHRYQMHQDHLSHDNITGLLSLMVLVGYMPKLESSMWSKYLHPRDLLFYLHLKNWPIPGFMLRFMLKKTIKKKYDYRHMIQFQVPEHKRTFKQKMQVRLTPIFPRLFKDEVIEIEATSGKLLAWLRCQALDWGEWFDENVTEEDMHRWFKLYFSHPKHPIRDLLN